MGNSRVKAVRGFSKKIFLIVSCFILFFSALQASNGFWLSSTMFMMPHLESIYQKIEDRSLDRRKKCLYRLLFGSNLLICVSAATLFFGFDVLERNGVMTLDTKTTIIKLFSTSFPYWIPAAIIGIWCLVNACFIWKHD